MNDFKLDIEVKVVVKPLSPKVGEEKRGPWERNMFLLSEKSTSHYVGEKADITTLAANAAKVLSRQWALSSNEAPQVLIEDAVPYGVTCHMKGKVHSHGVSTVVSFEYGLTTAMGTSIAATQSPVSTDAWIAVSRSVSGLTAETNYYYRVKCISDGVTIYSPLRRFKTLVAGITSTTTTTTTAAPTTTTTTTTTAG